jgi:hypothetical protein
VPTGVLKNYSLLIINYSLKALPLPPEKEHSFSDISHTAQKVVSCETRQQGVTQ